MVQYIADKTGRFIQRPHYKPEELDHECESIMNKFLTSRYGKIQFPVSTEDLTCLIEQDTADLDLYADLSEFGSDVEGVTEFMAGKKPTVKISQHLANDKQRENRLRTTLTHEYGHVRFHAYLWELELPGDLLKTNPNANKQICKRDNILNAAQYDWMEWQAGYICGALLMPLSHIQHIVRAYQEKHDLFGSIYLNSDYGSKLIEEIRTGFMVSAEAARVRLMKLGFISDAQPSLSLF